MLAEMRTRQVAASLDELLAGATSREPMGKPGDSLSGSHFERVVIDGDAFVLKHLHVDDDWIQRITGDVTCVPVRVWSSGILERVRDIIDDTIVGCATGLGRNGWGAAVLMRDVGDCLVPEGNGRIPAGQHVRFIEHMATMHARFWGFEDPVGLLPMGNRYRLLTPLTSAIELERSDVDPVPGALADGWRTFPLVARRSAAILMPLLDDPTPLVKRLERLPQTLVHSDWKLGNLGTLADGRTILIDWAWPGRAPCCVDLAWYLAVNCDRNPQSKEDTIAAYRAALEQHGVETASWWDETLSLCMLGAFLHLGWSKSGDELAWWDERAPGWARYL
jgi:hypothetical protein